MKRMLLLRNNRRSGFTLVEVMMVCCILGVLAALALPAFTGYVRQSRTSEATTNLNNIFKSAVAFYVRERSQKGVSGNISSNCIVATSAQSPSAPDNTKQRFTADPVFQTLGFTISDYVYYGYGIVSSGTANAITCGLTANQQDVYTFYAHGDIDGDTITSTFQIAAGTDASGELYHGRGIYVMRPIE